MIEAEFEGIAKIEADTMGVFVKCTPGDEVMEISSLHGAAFAEMGSCKYATHLRECRSCVSPPSAGATGGA